MSLSPYVRSLAGWRYEELSSCTIAGDDVETYISWIFNRHIVIGLSVCYPVYPRFAGIPGNEYASSCECYIVGEAGASGMASNDYDFSDARTGD
jgi:hypothetical protein